MTGTKTASLASRIVLARKRSGLSKTELASRLGVSLRAVQYWEDVVSTRIRLTGRRDVGEWVTVDDDLAGWLSQWHWHLGKDGYAVRSARFKGGQYTYGMHRQILGLLPGDDREADHINGERLDNRQENLRAVTGAVNRLNRTRGCGKYGLGVSYDAAKQKPWRGKLKNLHLGWFATQDEATQAVRVARHEALLVALIEEAA